MATRSDDATLEAWLIIVLAVGVLGNLDQPWLIAGPAVALVALVVYRLWRWRNPSVKTER